MEEPNLSKDYVGAFRRAKEIGNLEEMEAAFRGLCSELGVEDPASDQAQREAGRLAAELMNAKAKGMGKRI